MDGGPRRFTLPSQFDSGRTYSELAILGPESGVYEKQKARGLAPALILVKSQRSQSPFNRQSLIAPSSLPEASQRPRESKATV
jgi:hypothetical protein